MAPLRPLPGLDGQGAAMYNKLIYYLYGGLGDMWIADGWQDYELLSCGGGIRRTLLVCEIAIA